MTPSFSDALAFHIRTFPSSEPDMTKRASPENIVDVTLRTVIMYVNQSILRVIGGSRTSACVWCDILRAVAQHLPSIF